MAPELVIVRGARDARHVLARWQHRPFAVLGPWLLGSLAITVALLLAVWAVASATTPDVPPHHRGMGAYLTYQPSLEVVLHVVQRNALVLALHAMACIAGFIAGSALPEEAARHDGRWRAVHDKAGPLAIAFVGAATTFSLVTQALVLGQGAADHAARADVAPAVLLLALLPHAIPELVALFLPLAAFVLCARRGAWDELFAATVVTVAVALPLLLLSAVVEVHISREVVLGL